MIELKLALDYLDYDSLVPLLISHTVKSPIAAKAAQAAYKAKTDGMTQLEKDAYAARVLCDNKDKIITVLNSKISEQGVKGYVTGFDANLL